MTETVEASPHLTDGAALARRSLWGTLVRNPIALTGLIVLAVVVLVAILADLLAPTNPLTASLDAINAQPGTPGHPLGGDSAGRDILSRLIFGSRVTLAAASVSILVALVVGVPTGLIAGYVGGTVDQVLSWVANVLMSLPAMVVLLAVISAIGPSVYPTMAAFGVMLAPGLFRLVRAQVIGVKNELYIDAARVSGLSNARIIGRHVLYVVRAPIIIQASIQAGGSIIVQSGLQFIGVGDLSLPSWGAMLNDAFNVFYLSPASLVWPGLAIAITVASLVLVGNGLRDAVQGIKPAPRVRHHARATGQPGQATQLVAAGRDNMLDVQNLKIGYPQDNGTWTVVVSDASLRMGRGEVLGLVGESGSGKTQTAFAVLGLLPRGGVVMDGSIVIGGKNVLTMAEKERRRLLGTTVGYIPQEPMSNLDPAFTIGHQLVEPLRVRGIGAKAAREKVLGLLAEVGIPDPPRTFSSYPHQVSGGMAQRILIAGAISGDPALLIADEPTTALDVTVQAEVLSLLRQLQKRRRMAVLLVTHNFGVVADLCDSVAVMRQGVVVESAPVAELFAAPQHPYTRMLLGSTLDDVEPRPPLGSTTKRLTREVAP